MVAKEVTAPLAAIQPPSGPDGFWILDFGF
jgi:hypothetical protein